MVRFEGETTTMEPATTLREAFQATNQQQSLASGDPYYVDLTQARNSRATVHMKQMIRELRRRAILARCPQRPPGFRQVH